MSAIAPDDRLAFRLALTALSRPGQPYPLPPPRHPWPPALPPSAAALLEALADAATLVFVAPGLAGEIGSALRRATGAPLTTDLRRAAFALIPCAQAEAALAQADAGSPETPETSTTLILIGLTFGHGPGLCLSGPGIKGTTLVHIAGLTAAFWQARTRLHARTQPGGIDLFVCAGPQVMGLPRSTHIQPEGA